MSKIGQEDVQCPHCDAESKQYFYVSVNVTIDPTLKDRILDGSLFKKTCPKCETDFDVRHDLLYHDMHQELCVWLKYENVFGEIELEAGAERAGRIFEGYKLRIVFGRDELIEKIELADDGHDDILIETVKIFHSIKNDIDLTSPFYYDRAETKGGRKNLIFTHTPTDSSPQEHSVDLLHAYEAVLPFTAQIANAIKSEWDPWMWVTRATILDALENCGLAEGEKGTRTRVHMLHPSKGYTVEEWVIEEEDEAAPFRDRVSGDLYAITFYEDGEPRTKLLFKNEWEEAQRLLDII